MSTPCALVGPRGGVLTDLLPHTKCAPETTCVVCAKSVREQHCRKSQRDDKGESSAQHTLKHKHTPYQRNSPAGRRKQQRHLDCTRHQAAREPRCLTQQHTTTHTHDIYYPVSPTAPSLLSPYPGSSGLPPHDMGCRRTTHMSPGQSDAGVLSCQTASNGTDPHAHAWGKQASSFRQRGPATEGPRKRFPCAGATALCVAAAPACTCVNNKAATRRGGFAQMLVHSVCARTSIGQAHTQTHALEWQQKEGKEAQSKTRPITAGCMYKKK